jgi:predicted ATPase
MVAGDLHLDQVTGELFIADAVQARLATAAKQSLPLSKWLRAERGMAMHIKRVHLRAFKRFHDLTVELAGTPRLVVMCGPNGIGKSSLIDALRLWHGNHGSQEGWPYEEGYHHKAGEPPLGAGEMVEVVFVEDPPDDPRKLVYARSAYRHEPEFQTSAITRQGELFSAPQSRRMIDAESKVSDNYMRLVSTTLDEIYSGKHDAESVGHLRDRHIGEIRAVIERLFPDLELQGPGDPVGGGTFYFSKAGRQEFHYKNLSGGEKAAFDLVLDMSMKTLGYDDTVFCIDEPELHMNPRLQAGLLDELLRLTAERGQLWVATHSIGMMRRAQELWTSDPNSVVFLDFEGNDFDVPVSLAPVEPTRQFWSRAFAVALGDIATLIAPDRVVLCEGRPASGSNPARAEFDARCYRSIFGGELPNTDFVSVGNASDVHTDRLEVGRAISALVSVTTVIRLIDRDHRTAQEVADLVAAGTRVLGRRHLESYVLDDEVVTTLCESAGRAGLAPDAVQLRDQAIANSVARGNDGDDVKSAADQFFTSVRRLLSLTRPGSTTEAFLADTLAPLLRPGMAVYAELRADIFGQ